jgi:hypothetical protein
MEGGDSSEARWLIWRRGGSLDERRLYGGVVVHGGGVTLQSQREELLMEKRWPGPTEARLLYGGEVTLRKQGGSYRGAVAPWMKGGSTEAWWVHGGGVTLQSQREELLMEKRWPGPTETRLLCFMEVR